MGGVVCWCFITRNVPPSKAGGTTDLATQVASTKRHNEFVIASCFTEINPVAEACPIPAIHSALKTTRHTWLTKSGTLGTEHRNPKGPKWGKEHISFQTLNLSNYIIWNLYATSSSKPIFLGCYSIFQYDKYHGDTRWYRYFFQATFRYSWHSPRWRSVPQRKRCRCWCYHPDSERESIRPYGRQWMNHNCMNLA